MIGGLLFQFEGKAIPAGKDAEVLAALKEKIPLVTSVSSDEAGVEVRTKQPISTAITLRSGNGGARRVRRNATQVHAGLRSGINSALDEIIPTLER